jgi:hypothetical protein
MGAEVQQRFRRTAYGQYLEAGSGSLDWAKAMPEDLAKALALPEPTCFSAERQQTVASGYGWDRILLCALGLEGGGTGQRKGISASAVERIVQESPDCVTREFARRTLEAIKAASVPGQTLPTVHW